ncbi:MAG: outer membrane protein assembly factor BamB [Methylophilus sp.]|nr:outer membrane protein assembly factor BamB [Methylophilus sp.]
MTNLSFQQLCRVAIAFSLLLLSACGSLSDLKNTVSDRLFGAEPANPPTELTEIKASYTPKIDWEVKLGETARYDYTPALEAGYVYGSNVEGDVVKVDVTNGKEVWRINIGEPISGGVGVGVGGALILVGTNKGTLNALDVSGKLLWKSRLSSEILSVPRYFDGKVIVRTGDNHIYGIDAADGNRKWVYERSTPSLSLRSSAGVVVDGGAVYSGFAGGKLVAIRADNGKLLWEASVAQPKGVTEIERIADITSLPFVDGPVVYAIAYQGRIAAVDRRSGQVVWNRDISSYNGLTAEDGKIFVSHTLGSVYALDYNNGRSFWRQGDLINRRLTTPLSMGTMIAVGDLEGYVHLLSRDDGKFVGRVKLDDNAVMSIIAGNDKSQLIAETRGGGLYAVTFK